MSREKDWLEKMLANITLSADYQKGLKAYQAGDYVTASSVFLLLAEAGDATAQTALGVMYADGKGGPTG